MTLLYLLVWVENAMGNRHYGISIVWANPNQVRAATMEEVVKKLTTCISCGTNWPYTLAQLHEGTHHMPLPKDGHLGILPQRGTEEAPCGWIIQLEVCQLLATSPQVIYPIGLNGHDEPIITSLPEPLASSVSLTAGKSIYLGIDIPSPPVQELDQKIPPLAKVSTIVIASPHKSPLKSEGSMTMEVSNLLSWAMLEVSSCWSEHLSPRRPTPVVVPITPPQKLEGPLQPVDTSSQVSIEVAETSLGDIPTSISPIAAVSRTRSITPLVDIMEFWTNANKALSDLLTTKASIDAQRWRAVWELGIVLHQNESQAAASIKEAKAVCSQVTLDALTTCFLLILEAKTACLMAVKKAKTNRSHMVQEAEATCSKVISKVKAQKVSQAALLQKEHGNIMQDLEEQVTGEESRSQASFLSTCQVILYNSPPELKSILATSYHILLGQTPPLPLLALPQRTSPVEEQPTPAAPPTPAPKQFPRPKRWHPSPDPWRVCLWVEPLWRLLWEDPPSSKRWERSPWYRTLKPSCAEAFSQDSDMVREARREFFLTHSYNFTTDGTCNLWGIFRQLAASANLLGTSIHEIQASWTGPEELKQVNYALWSLPKGLCVVPLSESPKVMALAGIYDLDALCHFSGITNCPWCGRRVKTREPWRITHDLCTTG